MIDFTNTKKSAIKGCKLTLADYKEVLNTLFKQANFDVIAIILEID